MKIQIALILCALSTSAHAFVPFVPKGSFWEDGYYDVYYNPKNISAFYGKNDPRLQGPLSLEVKKEIQNQMFEELILSTIHTLNSIPDSVLVATYRGRTDQDCGIRSRIYDGINAICWIPNSGMEYNGFIHPGLATHSLDYYLGTDNGKYSLIPFRGLEAEILINTDVDNLKYDYVLLHEMIHNVGLDHENSVPSMMQNTIPVWGFRYTPQPDDIAGIQAQYPFTKECASTVTDVNGQLRITVQMHLDGELYRGDLGLSGLGTHLNVIPETVVAGKDARGEKSCALKPGPDGYLEIPYIRLGEGYYSLALQIENLSFKILDLTYRGE